MSMWCPNCKSEYRDGFTECADCGVALVDALPSSPEPAKRTHVEHRPITPDDDLFEVARLTAVEAELVAGQLRGAGIAAVVLGLDAATGSEIRLSEGSRVMVRRADVDAADQIVADLASSDRTMPPITDEELAAQAEQATGWSDPASGAVV